MRIYYTCIGEVRGDCGHKHKTVETAYKCYKEDQDACVRQGGYSDRSVYEVEDGEETMIAFNEDDY